jgi:pimeloyl-ACP methyl ester carboxylesterase
MAKAGDIFETPDFVVRRGLVFDSPVCFVTFSSHALDRSLERPGFGEQFLQSRGINALHVINRTNRWYDHREIAQALACIRQAASGFSKVITYGSSMGGYAAIRFAEAVGAQSAIALSPQYGLGAPSAPFETRFVCDLTRFSRRYLGPWHRSATVTPYVFFDSKDLDARHAQLIARHYPNTVTIGIPHAGHPVGAYLDEAGLLTGAVLSIAAGTFDAAAFTAQARRKRHASSQYLYTLASRLRPGRADLKLALVDRAIQQRDDAVFRLFLSLMREAQGDLTGAEDQLRIARDLLPGHQRIMGATAAFLIRRRQWAAAETVLVELNRLCAGYPENTRYRQMLIVALAMQAKSLKPVLTAPPAKAGIGAALVNEFEKACLLVDAFKARLYATEGRSLPLPGWRKTMVSLPVQFRWTDEWERRRTLRRKLARAGV